MGDMVRVDDFLGDPYMIQESRFGKDHWSLLAYIGTRCQDHKGVLNPKHLRIKHPALRTGHRAWKPEYGTRLAGYWREDGTTNGDLLLPDHDDMDCFDDLEKAGYIKSFGTGLNPACILTKKGLSAIQRLIEHKQMGDSL